MKWLVACLLFVASAAPAQTLPKEQLARVDFEQRLGARVPLNAEFRDENGAPVRLGQYFGERPVILALAYYDCPNLCTIVLNGLLESARNIRLEAGRDFEIVVVSIRPGDDLALARQKKETYTRRYGRPGSAHGWHFLSGETTPIRELSEAVGFHAVYDPASKQFAHASGIVVLTPQGTVSRYFLGIEYPPKDVRLALVEASQQKIGTLADRLLLLCFHYDPNSGRYTLLITRLLQFAGCGTVLLLGAFIVRASRTKPSATTVFALIPLAPVRASNLAGSVDALFYALLALCSLVTIGVVVMVLYACIRFREGSSAPRQPGHNTSLALELAWTSATLLAFVGIFVWAAAVYFRMARPPADAIEVQVVAKQWMWKAQHANGRREINELHLLVGQPVKLIMTSQDVIHDFFVPAFRTKGDVLPGRYTQEWFTPTRAGDFRLFCAEYCGTDHSRMGGWVHVLEPAEHARWMAEQAPGESLVAAGARLFIARGCSGCHSPQAAVRAPLLNGLYRKPVALADGSIVLADDQYLHDSILLPMKQITAGYQPVMPTYQGQLNEEEVMQLIAYLKARGAEPGDAP